MWAGNNTPDANAKFRVGTDGTLYARNAVFGAGTSVEGYATSVQLSAVDTKATNAASSASTASTNASTALTNAQTAATDANTAKVAAAAAKAIADAALPSTSFDRAAIVAKISTGTDTTRIDGGLLKTGTVSADAVVTDFISAFSINASKITTGTISGIKGIFTDGEVGGFTLGNADLTASTSKLPRIIFGNKVLIGYDSSNGAYTLNAGNPYTDSGGSFYVNTNSNVFRFAADSASRSYAAEIRNTVRARTFRYIVESVLDSSSRRFKENIVDVPKHYYERILKVKPTFFTYINNHPETQPEVWGNHGMGPIVEDLEEAGLGIFVERNLNGQPTSLRNPQNMAFLLIPVVRDLKAQVDTLEARLIELEGNNV